MRLALAGAFREFAPCADSGLRGAGRADGGGDEAAPVNCAKNAPLQAWECPGEFPACPPNRGMDGAGRRPALGVGGGRTAGESEARRGHRGAGRREQRNECGGPGGRRRADAGVNPTTATRAEIAPETRWACQGGNPTRSTPFSPASPQKSPSLDELAGFPASDIPLAERGADVNAKFVSDDTPLDIAIQERRAETRFFLAGTAGDAICGADGEVTGDAEQGGE